MVISSAGSRAIGWSGPGSGPGPGPKCILMSSTYL